MTPEYFKRVLRPYEAEHYIEGVMMRQRPGWEQARLVAHRSLMPWSKDLKMQDVAQFPWESEERVEATREEIEEAQQWATIATEYLRSKKHG